MLVTFSNREPSVCKLKPFDTLNSDMVVCNYMHGDATKNNKIKRQECFVSSSATTLKYCYISLKNKQST